MKAKQTNNNSRNIRKSRSKEKNSRSKSQQRKWRERLKRKLHSRNQMPPDLQTRIKLTMPPQTKRKLLHQSMDQVFMLDCLNRRGLSKRLLKKNPKSQQFKKALD